MSTLTTPLSPRAGAPRWERLRAQAATTPGLFLGAFAVIGLTAFVLWLVAANSLARTRQTVQTIGLDSVPSIIAAQKIRAGLADMDASTANVFLGGGAAIQSVKDEYEQDRKSVADQLVTAAQNITYGNEERVPIVTMIDQLQIYTGYVKSARAKGQPYGIKDQRAATQLMHATLLPAADALDAANFQHLDREYAASRSAAAGVQAGVMAAGLLVLAALIATQIFLSRRTRRTFNVPLLLASATLLLFLGSLMGALRAGNEQLRIAKEDAFDSLHALWQARAVADDANADESLYLISPSTAPQYEQSFRENSARLAEIPVSEQTVQDAMNGSVAFHGFLGDELRNITFPGERDAALDTLRRYSQYMAIDAQIRTYERNGQHPQAVALDIGTQPGQSNWAFAQFDAALGRTLDINQKAFDAGIQGAFSSLRWLPDVAPVAALLIVALSWLGLAPRIQEYRG